MGSEMCIRDRGLVVGVGVAGAEVVEGAGAAVGGVLTRVVTGVVAGGVLGAVGSS